MHVILLVHQDGLEQLLALGARGALVLGVVLLVTLLALVCRSSHLLSLLSLSVLPKVQTGPVLQCAVTAVLSVQCAVCGVQCAVCGVQCLVFSV